MKVSDNLTDFQDAIAELSHCLATENKYIPTKFYEWLLNSEEAYSLLFLCVGFLKFPEFAMFIYETFKSTLK